MVNLTGLSDELILVQSLTLMPTALSHLPVPCMRESLQRMVRHVLACGGVQRNLLAMEETIS